MSDGKGRLPYPGLRAFDRDEADLFFGRDGAVNEMIDKLARTRFLAVLGASGTGKSSLVKTGLLDGLELGLHPAGANWLFCTVSPGGQPLTNLAAGLLALEEEDRSGDTIEARIDGLEWFLRRGPRSLIEWVNEGHRPDDANLLVLVDQFEELFRFGGYSDREAAEAFVKLLIIATSDPDSRVHVVLTMRSEFLGACALIPWLAESINAGSYLTPRMTREECREAIIGPARMVGAEIEPGLVNTILNDLVNFAPWSNDQSSDPLRSLSRRADQLPVMQHLLNRLWKQAESRSGHAVLTLKEYEALGGLGGALDAHGEEILATLSEEQLGLVEKMFRALVDGPSPITATRRPLRFGDLAEEIGTTTAELAPMVEAFRDDTCNFLCPGSQVPLTNNTVIDISHESLIRQWSKLSEWVTEEARAANYLRRLANAEKRYRMKEGDVLSGLDLANISDWRRTDLPEAAWARRYTDKFPEIETFLRESEKREIDRRTKEKKLETRHKRRLNFFAVSSSSLAIVAVVFFLRSEAETRQAQENFSMVENATERLAIGMVERFENGLNVPAATKIALIQDTEKALQSLTSRAGRETALLYQRANFYLKSAETLLSSGYLRNASELAEKLRAVLETPPNVWSPDPELQLRAALVFARINRGQTDYAATQAELDRAAAFIDELGAENPVARAAQATLLQERAQIHLDFNQYHEVLHYSDELFRFYGRQRDLLNLLMRQSEGAPSDDLRAMQEATSQAAEAVIHTGFNALVAMGRLHLKERGESDPQFYLQTIEAALSDTALDGVTDNRTIRFLEARVVAARGWYQHKFGAGTEDAMDTVSEAIDLYGDLTAEDRGSITYRRMLLYTHVVRLSYAVDSGHTNQVEEDIVASRSLVLDLRLSGDSSASLAVVEAWIAYYQWHAASGESASKHTDLAVRRILSSISPIDGEAIVHPAIAAPLMAEHAWAALSKSGDDAPDRETVLRIAGNALAAFGPEQEIPTDRYYALRQRQRIFQRILEQDTMRIGPDDWMHYHEMAIAEAKELNSMAPQMINWRANIQYFVGLAGYAYDQMQNPALKRSKNLEALELAIELLDESPTDATYFGNALIYAREYTETLKPDADLSDLLAPLRSFISTSIDSDRHWELMNERASHVTGFVNELESLKKDVEEGAITWSASDAISAMIDSMNVAVTRAEDKARESAVLIAEAETETGDASIAPRHHDLRQLDIRRDENESGPLGWAHPPLFESSWRTLDGAEFKTALKSIVFSLSEDKVSQVNHIRKTKLNFYDSGDLMEIQIVTPNGPKLKSYLVFDNGNAYELNGTSPPIHEANAMVPLKLSSIDQVSEYLRFFTLFVNGDEGAFRIVEHPDDLYWNGYEKPSEITAVRNAMRPFLIWHDADKPSYWRATGTVSYADSLFHAFFLISPNGPIEMEDDIPVVTDLNLYEVKISDRANGIFPVRENLMSLDYLRLDLKRIGSLEAELEAAIYGSFALPDDAGDLLRRRYSDLALQPETTSVLLTYNRDLNSFAYEMLLRDKSLDDALRLSRRAHESSPEDPYIMDTYGWALLKTGETQEAILTLKAASEIDPSQAEIMAHLGQAYRLAGDLENARGTLNKAKELDPQERWLDFIEAELALLDAK